MLNFIQINDMNKSFNTEQEAFWNGEFGSEYTARNRGGQIVAGNLAMFSRIFARTANVGSVIELGANIGMNIQAIRQLLPEASLSAVEINADAVDELKALGDIKVYHESILDFQPDRRFDLVLIKGVLIHINPDRLNDVYDLAHASSQRYICFAEYYNPTPVALPYRGHAERLFKRDFAGELMDRHPGLKLVDYGFCYHRDPAFPLDDITWFLMEKTA